MAHDRARRISHYAAISKGGDMDKRCPQCGEIKPLTEFHKDSKRKDGLAFRCKVCAIKLAKAYNETHKERHKEERRKRGFINSETHKRLNKEYAKRFPERVRANYLVNRAVRTKQIPPVKERACDCCGEAARHYHHPDYSKPLEVVPLCESCHRRAHSSQKA